jgi:succinate dehydrogenase/fumarate reductase flavoprotein subunit
MVSFFYESRRRAQAMAKARLVVIGGDAAGMSAAAQAKRLNKDLDVIAFEKGPHTSYSA